MEDLAKQTPQEPVAVEATQPTSNLILIPNQYIFILSPVIHNVAQIEEAKKRLLPYKKKEIKRCKCNPALRLFEFYEDIDIDIYLDGNQKGNLWYIQIEDRYYSIEQAMPNGIHGSPDDEDPTPKSPPIVRAGGDAENQLDEYVPLRKAWLDEARNHSFRLPNAPVVAIMDSGIDLEYFTNDDDTVTFPLHYYKNHPCDISPNLCYVKDLNCCEGLYGWNFIKNDPHLTFPENPFDDDLRHKHGTRIAAIIANVTKNNVRIMPLKTANYKGESAFFDIFCSFEFILNYNKRSRDEDKVRFINASWGYYGRRYAMFTYYMDIDKLDLRNPKEDNEFKIKFINAAGNAGDDVGDGVDRRDSTRLKIGESNSEFDRYPTMYSETFDRVYTATTIEKVRGQYKAIENYSKKYVEIGVIGETKKNSENIDVPGTFPDPLGGILGGYIKGSSYATAFLTGCIVNGQDYKHLNQAEIEIAGIVATPPNIFCPDVNSGIIEVLDMPNNQNSANMRAY